MKRLLVAFGLCLGSLSASMYRIDITGTIDRSYFGEPFAGGTMIPLDLGNDPFRWSFTFDSTDRSGRITLQGASVGSTVVTSICNPPITGQPVGSSTENCRDTSPLSWELPQTGLHTFGSPLGFLSSVIDLDTYHVEFLQATFNAPRNPFFLNVHWNTSQASAGWTMFGQGYVNASGRIGSVTVHGADELPADNAVPEPSTLAMAAPVLLIWGYRGIRRRAAA